MLGILLNIFPDEAESFFKQFNPPPPAPQISEENKINWRDQVKERKVFDPSKPKVQR